MSVRTMTTTVTNMRDGRTAVFDQPPQRAVELAHRQLTLGDYNWWVKREGVVVEHGNHFVFCGDWAARYTSCASAQV